jgi:hypothetical protein
VASGADSAEAYSAGKMGHYLSFKFDVEKQLFGDLELDMLNG